MRYSGSAHFCRMASEIFCRCFSANTLLSSTGVSCPLCAVPGAVASVKHNPGKFDQLSIKTLEASDAYGLSLSHNSADVRRIGNMATCSRLNQGLHSQVWMQMQSQVWMQMPSSMGSSPVLTVTHICVTCVGSAGHFRRFCIHSFGLWQRCLGDSLSFKFGIPADSLGWFRRMGRLFFACLQQLTLSHQCTNKAKAAEYQAAHAYRSVL